VQAGETKETQPAGRAQATEEKAPAGEGMPAAAVTTTPTADDPQPEAVKSSTEAASPEQFDRPEHDKAATTTEPEQKPSTQADPEAVAPALSEEEKAQFQESPGPNVEVPHETPQPVALQPTEDPEAVYQQVLQEQLDKGSSPQVAEARAKVARVKAQRGIKRGPTPIETDKMVPSAPTKGHPVPEEPSGAPEAKEPQPEQGPVAAETQTEAPELSGGRPGPGAGTSESSDSPRLQPEAAPSEPAPANRGAAELASDAPASSPAAAQPQEAAPTPQAAADTGSSDDPDAVYERVLAEERAKGSSDAVAQGRAKAARVKAERAKKAGG
jgi:hypothetical protein